MAVRDFKLFTEKTSANFSNLTHKGAAQNTLCIADKFCNLYSG